MQLSPPPDLSSNKRLMFTAAAVALCASLGLVWHTGSIADSLGDSDDAMRLVLVRDLMAGHGWYDQLVTRLQPPHGVYMHWSRLLDGALAVVVWLFGLVMSPAAAETATRFIWPLAWTVPTVAASLAIARQIGGATAVFVAAVLFASNQQPFAEFMPGRIDHHNIQIAMTMIAAACAVAREERARWAIAAGLSSALGLAIGIEALPFHALIGASYALRTSHDAPHTARNYAVTLLGATLFLFCLQTPPWRWSMSFCDAIGLNLVAGLAVASAGLLILESVAAQISIRGRLMIAGATILAAGCAYLALDPACIRGPLAAVDPRIRPFWFNLVDELKPLSAILKEYPDRGIALIVVAIMVVASAAALLVRRWPRPDSASLLSSALAILAIAGGIAAFREENYVLWLGFPLLATGLSLVAQRLWRGVMVPTVVLAVLLSPAGVVAAVRIGETVFTRAPRAATLQNSQSRCYETAAYKPLAALPQGLVLADITMGPYILANTHHAVLSAPYHRMVWGILAAHDALAAPGAEAERKFRALGIGYLVECAKSAIARAPGSIDADVAGGNTPAWLEPLSQRNAILQIYRVRPPLPPER